MISRQIILVDMDGTLCKETCWTPEECEAASPRLDVVKAVNQLYEKNFIVIYTARRDHLLPATLCWLRKYGVLFCAISNNKTPGDLYIDDKFIRPEEIDSLFKEERPPRND